MWKKAKCKSNNIAQALFRFAHFELGPANRMGVGVHEAKFKRSFDVYRIESSRLKFPLNLSKFFLTIWFFTEFERSPA